MQPDNFLNELTAISQQPKQQLTFDKLDFSDLDSPPPKKKELKKVYATNQFRRRKK